MCAAALEEYCGSTFWNASYLMKEDPDLPVCFEQTVLVWIPLGFLWLCAPWHLVHFCKRRRVNTTPGSKLYLIKQAVAFLLLVGAIVTLILTFVEDYGHSIGSPRDKMPAVYYTNPVLFAVAWILVLLCQEAVRRTEGRIDSAPLFCFWFLLVLCDIFPCQTLIREAVKKEQVSDVPRFCLFLINFELEILALCLSAMADIPPEAKEAVKKNPQRGATLLSRLTFTWLSSMMIKGHKHPLVQEDMWELDNADSTGHISQNFQYFMQSELSAAQVRYQKRLNKKRLQNRDEALEEAQRNTSSSGLRAGVSQDVLVMEGRQRTKKKKETDYPNLWLISTICKTFKWLLLEAVIFKLLQDLLSFVSPQLLKLLISFTHDKSIHAWKGYMYAVLLLVVAFAQSMFLQQYFHRCFVLGTKVRTAIMAVVYKKALVMSNYTRKQTTVGETVNLMSADAQRFNDMTNFIHLLWSCPLQLTIAIGFLWVELGPSVLAGVAVMMAIIPFNTWLGRVIRDIQEKNMGFKDKRLKVMNEIFNGIKILKLYAWEESFQEQVEEIREQELNVMRKCAYLTALSNFIFMCTPALVSVVAFAVFVTLSSDNVLTAEKAFTAISLFNILRFPLTLLPMLISSMAQTYVSMKRLEKFLGGEDLETSFVQSDPNSNSAVGIHDGSFAWEREAEPLLKDVSLNIEPGKLVAVVGAVGSGKSSLISALLGEMHCTKGFVNIQGSLALVPQQAWIQNASLKDNILFGSPHEENRFETVMAACALGPDLELLPGRELTEIGEKGVNLSGGQRQRVSLARAAYSKADIYLFDDPLSAVDSHVGKHIFDKVIGPRGLLKNKTRILVTHGVSFLPYVDEIVVLTNGQISEVGSYSNLRASGGAFSAFLDEFAQEQRVRTQSDLATGYSQETLDLDVTLDMEDIQPDAYLTDAVSIAIKRENSTHRSQGTGSIRVRTSQSRSKKSIEAGTEGPQRLIEKETMETGQVKFSLYLLYLRALGWGYSSIAFLMYFMQSIALIGQNLWLSDWTNDSVAYANKTYPASKRDTRVGVFGALGVAQGIFVFFGTLVLATASVAASNMLHSQLLNNLLRVPMVFFDTTPLGRVVNRFAKDIYTIDEAIPQTFRSWILCLFGVLACLLVICLATPFFTIVIVPLAVIYYLVQRFYVASSRQLRRLDSVSRSPIFSHLSETVSGLSVIRAYKHQDRFLKHNERIMDENLMTVYPWVASNRWLGIRLEFIGTLVVFFSAIFAVIARHTLDSGLVGLSISYALNVTQTLNWLVRTFSELETNIVAVERVNEYAKVENEAEWITDTRPPKNWPQVGRLQFDNFKVRYRPGLDLVLHGITCDIKSAERIGIVGRTGAGKSSLISCIFRIIEAAEGRILIDNIDISTIGLHDLRSKLTIIPQEPVLFSGTLRRNVDPFGKCSDEEIQKVLQLSHLKDYVDGLQDGLQHEVSEGGENLSVGQRQLLCLARALLRKSRILILDEATAAIDLETDNLIQKTIRDEFTHCTVITIAHRLHTIMDSSRIMVLDKGNIVEFDSPNNLLEKRGHFYAMARDAGIAQYVTAL